MVSCQKGPTRHAFAWQIGPFWQDTLDILHANDHGPNDPGDDDGDDDWTDAECCDVTTDREWHTSKLCKKYNLW